jgi:prepilin-type N-terminal cleavage/methylation domain-containing protein
MPLNASFRGDRGFTLIEVLVSLTMMALITGVAFAGLSAAIESWQRGSQRIEELDRRHALGRLIRRQIAQANPGLFRGAGRQLEFVSAYSLATGTGSPVWVRYVVGDGELDYSEMPLPEFVLGRVEPEIAQTFTGLPEVGFRYVLEGPSGQPSWAGSWTLEKELPIAVQVRIGANAFTVPLVNRNE